MSDKLIKLSQLDYVKEALDNKVDRQNGNYEYSFSDNGGINITKNSGSVTEDLSVIFPTGLDVPLASKWDLDSKINKDGGEATGGLLIKSKNADTKAYITLANDIDSSGLRMNHETIGFGNSNNWRDCQSNTSLENGILNLIVGGRGYKINAFDSSFSYTDHSSTRTYILPPEGGMLGLSKNIPSLQWSSIKEISSSTGTNKVSLGDLSSFKEIKIVILSNTAISCTHTIPINIINGDIAGKTFTGYVGSTAKSTIIIFGNNLTDAKYMVPNYVSGDTIKIYGR